MYTQNKWMLSVSIICIVPLLVLSGCSDSKQQVSEPGMTIYDKPPETATAMTLIPDEADFGDEVLVLITVTNIGDTGGTFEFEEVSHFGIMVNEPNGEIYESPVMGSTPSTYLTLEPGESRTDTLRYIAEGRLEREARKSPAVPIFWLVHGGVLGYEGECPWDEVVLRYIK